jgi:hypothetical protein
VNRGGQQRARRGMARLIGGGGTRRGPVAAAGVRAGVRASGQAVTGHRQAGLGSTVPGDAVKASFELKSEFKRGQMISNLAQTSIDKT